MSVETKRFPEEWPAKMRELNWHAPEAAKMFSYFFHGLMGHGALSVREKELIALGIGLAVRCIPSIHVHTEKALQAGASREEIFEAAGVAVVMQGGATYTCLPCVLEALDAASSKESVTVPAPQPHVVHSESD